jgi:hypothetical protein
MLRQWRIFLPGAPLPAEDNGRLAMQLAQLIGDYDNAIRAAASTTASSRARLRRKGKTEGKIEGERRVLRRAGGAGS